MANEALVFPEGSSHSSPERLPRHPILENCDHTFGVGVKIDMAEPTTDFAVWNRNERSSGRGRCACFNRRAASGYRSLAVCERYGCSTRPVARIPARYRREGSDGLELADNSAALDRDRQVTPTWA